MFLLATRNSRLDQECRSDCCEEAVASIVVENNRIGWRACSGGPVRYGSDRGVEFELNLLTRLSDVGQKSVW